MSTKSQLCLTFFIRNWTRNFFDVIGGKKDLYNSTSLENLLLIIMLMLINEPLDMFVRYDGKYSKHIILLVSFLSNQITTNTCFSRDLIIIFIFIF